MMYYKPTTPYNSLEIKSIYTIHYFEYHKDFSFSGEKHNFWEIMYVDRGEIAATADEKSFVLKQNQLVVYSPDEFHALHANNITAPNTIIVSFDCNSKSLNALKNQIFYINEHMRSMLAGIVREAKKAYSNNLSDPEYRKLIKAKRKPEGTDSFAAEQMITCYLQMLLIELLRSGGYNRHTRKSTVQKNEFADKFKLISNWIDDHIDRKFTINDLCAECITNKQTLENIFKTNVGMSVIEFCRKRKIDFAKKYLREDALNITQISEKLGFSSVHYFTRTFKKVENMTPSEYAKSAKAIIDHSERVSNPKIK
ncbi:MAG: helix-turn-helix domain-containing protein [Ruminococcaceae bacterium]|nr:helix-turn-helix domain-containing protein [Oscillospiraceae bacterium]